MINHKIFLFSLLKKRLSGGPLTPEEKEYLRTMQAFLEEAEWDRLVVEAVAEVVAEEKAAGKVPPPRIELDFTKIAAAAKKRKRRANLFSLYRFLPLGLAAASILLIFLIVTRNRGSQLIDAHLCKEIPADTEIPLSNYSIWLGQAESPQSMHRVEAGKVGEVYSHGRLDVHRTPSGILELGFRPLDATDTSAYQAADSAYSITFQTQGQQQAEIQLPDHTLVRLHAGSSLTYQTVGSVPDLHTPDARLFVRGDAWVRTPENLRSSYLLLTENAEIALVSVAQGASFTMSSTTARTEMTLYAGALHIRSRTGDIRQSLDIPGQQGQIRTEKTLDGQTHLRWQARMLDQIEPIPVWTQTIRHFKNVSLREFVYEMSRWYGVRIDKFECIPSHLQVNVSICYRSDLSAMIAVLNKSGIFVQQDRQNNILSFCQPADLLKNPNARVVGFKD